MRLSWDTQVRLGYTREVARLGTFELTITGGGTGTVGLAVYVGSFAGVVCAIQTSFASCEREVLKVAHFELAQARVALGNLAAR